MNDLNCPYCGAELDVNHEDGQNYEQDVKHEMECLQCDRRFVFTTEIIFRYEAEKADCLNGGNHDWQPTHTYPKEFTEMECTICGDRREPTDEEMALILAEED